MRLFPCGIAIFASLFNVRIPHILMHQFIRNEGCVSPLRIPNKLFGFPLLVVAECVTGLGYSSYD